MATTLTRQNSIFHTHTLPNGLQMLGQVIPGVQSVTVVFYANTGTRDEEEAQMGVSHFLEHMAFRRTPRFTGEEIDRAFEEMGADHNAGTWKEMTFYYCHVLGENVEGAIDLLSDLTRPVIDSHDFDQERNVILEEIARYEDIPTHVLTDHFMTDIYGKAPLAWETLGTSESIKALTPSQMKSYWQKRYGTRNLIFAIAGNFDWGAVTSQVETITENWHPGESGRMEQPAAFTPSFRVYTEQKFVQEQMAIGAPSVRNTDPRYFTAAVLATILGDDTGSRLYWALYQEGLVDSASAQVFDFDDNGLFFIHIATQPSMAQRALEVAEQELARIQRFDIQQDELERARAKLVSSVIIGGESTHERALALVNSWLTQGRLETLEEIRQKIEAVTLDDLRSYLNEFPLWPSQVVTAVGPLGEDELTNPGV